jgi:hypothetical protein
MKCRGIFDVVGYAEAERKGEILNPRGYRTDAISMDLTTIIPFIRKRKGKDDAFMGLSFVRRAVVTKRAEDNEACCRGISFPRLIIQD